MAGLCCSVWGRRNTQEDYRDNISPTNPTKSSTQKASLPCPSITCDKSGASRTTTETDLIETEDEVKGLKPAFDSHFSRYAQESPHRLISFIKSVSTQTSIEKKIGQVVDGGDLSMSSKAKGFKLAISPAFDRTSMVAEHHSDNEIDDTVKFELESKPNKDSEKSHSKVKLTRLRLLQGLESCESQSPKKKPFVVKPSVLNVEKSSNYQDDVRFQNKSLPALGQFSQHNRHNSPLYKNRMVEATNPSKPLEDSK